MTNYNIKINSQYNSTEIFFNGKPEEATRNILKSNGFKWNPKKSCWYGFATPDQIAAALEGTTAPVKEAKKAAEIINLDNIQSLPCLYGSELTAAIREDLKKRGVKGVTVRGRRGSGITVTIKATADDIASVEEMKTRYNYSHFTCDADRGFFNGSRWIYNFYDLSEEERQTEYNNNIMHQLKSVNSFSIYHHERNECPELTTAFYNKCLAIYKIANQWNYDNSDIMTDYFDRGYYLDIDIKKADDFEPRQEMTEAEREDYAEEVRQEEEQRKADLARWEAEQEEARKAREAYEAKRTADREIINNNAVVEDLTETIYITNLVGGIGKEANLEELNESIENHSDRTHEALITRKVNFSTVEAYETFTNYLLDDFSFLDGMGGTGTEDIRINSTSDFYKLNEEQRETVKVYMTKCVGIYLNGELQLISDPEGYSYSRYTYKPTENSEIKNGTEEIDKQKEESESKTPFYFPEAIEKQAESIYPGQQITVYQSDGWNLCSIYGGSGTVTEVTPGSYAQYDGIYITMANGKKLHRVFLRDSKKCLVYSGIRPNLPENLLKRRITDTMSELLNADEIFPLILSHYPDSPIIDTIQR